MIEELQKEYDTSFKSNQYGLPDILKKIYSATGERFVFIIDEWDYVFRIAKNRKEIQKRYLDFLRGLFKGQNYVELAYMTGILPIKKYGEHSAINIFDEYSIVSPKCLREYFGFMEAEVREICIKYDVDFTELKKWYDGYRLGALHIYNPKSVVDALTRKEIQSYWTGTETYEALKVYIDINFDGLKEAVMTMLGNGRCKINTKRFQNDMTTLKTKDDVLTLLIHLGYLTYDTETKEAFIPNQEIANEFLNAIDGSDWNSLVQALQRSEQLLQDTWDLNDILLIGINYEKESKIHECVIERAVKEQAVSQASKNA